MTDALDWLADPVHSIGRGLMEASVRKASTWPRGEPLTALALDFGRGFGMRTTRAGRMTIHQLPPSLEVKVHSAFLALVLERGIRRRSPPPIADRTPKRPHACPTCGRFWRAKPPPNPKAPEKAPK